MKHLSFTVMSLNLRFGLADDGPNSWVHRRLAYKPLFDAWPRDFYAFQEANDFQITFLSELLPEHDHIGQRDPAPQRWQSNVIFYHKAFRCIYSEHFYLSETPDIPSQFPDSRWPRQGTLGIFEKDARRLIVVNTHLDFYENVQISSARLIRQRLAVHADKNAAAVLMGDFNCTPESACYAEFMSKTDGGPILRNVFAPPFQGTHHPFNGTDAGAAIDWILYQKPLVVERACVIKSPFGQRYPSDHFPVIADFGIPDTCVR
jgi:endonuclease/exonuclease/phosphatase family metal-dependent hydrolase